MTHLFLAAVTDLSPELITTYEGWLGADEQARLTRYQGRRRLEYLLGRALLRWALCKVTNTLRSPADWNILEQPDLPPAIPEAAANGWFFSLSHSRGQIAVLLSKTGECGVDIEYCKPRRDYLGLADGWFHLDEIATLQTLSPTDQHIYFYRYWTLKEAWLKQRKSSLFSGEMAKVQFKPVATPAGAMQTLINIMACRSVSKNGIGADKEIAMQTETLSLAVVVLVPSAIHCYVGLPQQSTSCFIADWLNFRII